MIEKILADIEALGVGITGRAIADQVRMLKDRRFITDKDYEQFLKFCCDSGLLDIVYVIFEDVDKNSLRLEGFKKNRKNISRIQKFSEDKLILSLQKKTLNYSSVYSGFEIKDLLMDFLTNLKEQEASAKENMILNAILILVLRSKQQLLTSDQCISLFNYFYSTKNINTTRREACILLIVEYCCYYDIEGFFKLPKKFYNHCSKVLSCLVNSTLLDHESLQSLIKSYLTKLRKFNDFKVYKHKKVAICISGMYRNHKEAILSIKENLVEPLEADVFIHTWDNMSVWSGLGGSPHYMRILGKGAKDLLPIEYHWLTKLEKILPRAYSHLEKTLSKKIDIEQVYGSLKPKKVIVESEEGFIEELGDISGFMRLRGISNQIKMFHGMKRSIDMALEEGKYDYIIRCRPDLLLTKGINKNKIDELENNIIYASAGTVGLSDGLFIISSSMAYNFSCFISDMYKCQELSPFVNFPEYDSHNLLGAWMTYNNYSCSECLIKAHILNNPEVPIPGLKNAVKEDYSNLSEENKALFKDFVEFLIKRNG